MTAPVYRLSVQKNLSLGLIVSMAPRPTTRNVYGIEPGSGGVDWNEPFPSLARLAGLTFARVLVRSLLAEQNDTERTEELWKTEKWKTFRFLKCSSDRRQIV